ncbi:MAG: radical SAM protein [Chitinophagales bacterium]
MKVVLALCPVWQSLTPNLALAYLKGSLQQAGYPCKTLDFSVEFRPFMVSVLGDRRAEDYVRDHPKLYKNWAKQIADENPDVVGLSLLGSNLGVSALVAKEIRHLMPQVLMVSGGPSLTRENSDSLEQALAFSNYVIEGEGEQALVDFVKCYEQKGDFKKLKQLWYLNETGQAQYTGQQPLQNINNIPYPDFSDFNRKAYPDQYKLPLLFSRGCILNCNYCENKWNHLTQRSRDGRNVFDELKFMVNKYGIKQYMFNDDSLISSKTMRQLDEYCDLVIAEGLVMPWSVYGTRVERLITQPFLHKLRQSGMERVSLGVESFSSRVQKEMGKSSRYDDADRMCRMFADEGIRTESWIIYGYPTETDADFEETRSWFIKNPNVLSHITANTFGPNAKYINDRPGVVNYISNQTGHWVGGESTLEKRKQRFLALIEVLEQIRIARKGQFTYHVGDPLYVNYFNSWTLKDQELLLKGWEKIENQHNRTTPSKSVFSKLLSSIGLSKPQAQPINRMPAAAEEKKELHIAPLAEMKQNISRKIEQELDKNSTLSAAEKAAKLQHYMQAIETVKVHLTDHMTEEIFFAMTQNGDARYMLSDLDTHAPEYIAQMALESSAKYILPETTSH